MDLVYLFSALGAALIGSAATFLLTKRTTSGTVETSEASQLWDVSNNIRSWLTSEVDALRARDRDQQLQIDQLRTASEACLEREQNLRDKLDRLGGTA